MNPLLEGNEKRCREQLLCASFEQLGKREIEDCLNEELSNHRLKSLCLCNLSWTMSYIAEGQMSLCDYID